MTKIRELKGISCSIADTSISRNNDVSGYWGLGMLYKEAITHGTLHVAMSLLTGLTEPAAPVSQTMVARYADYLSRRLAGLQIRGAHISVSFRTAILHAPALTGTDGDPFVCTVTLIATTGQIYSCSRAGRCRPHSSSNERCSDTVQSIDAFHLQR